LRTGGELCVLEDVEFHLVRIDGDVLNEALKGLSLFLAG